MKELHPVGGVYLVRPPDPPVYTQTHDWWKVYCYDKALRLKVQDSPEKSWGSTDTVPFSNNILGGNHLESISGVRNLLPKALKDNRDHQNFFSKGSSARVLTPKNPEHPAADCWYDHKCKICGLFNHPAQKM